MKKEILKNTVRALLVATLVFGSWRLWASRSSGAEAVTPDAPTATKKKITRPWYILPQEAGKVLRYRCTWSGSQYVARVPGHALLSATFELWSAEKDRLRLKIVALDGFMKTRGQKKPLKLAGNGGRSWSIVFSGFGQGAFKCDAGKDCPADIAMVHGLYRNAK